MVEMKAFVLWCLETIPAVLLEPPFSAFVGLFLLFFTGRIVYHLCHF